MFTGIIQAVVPIVTATQKKECLVARIKKPKQWKLALGQSITVDGICSTVTNKGPSFFEVEYMPETLAKTTAGLFRKGRSVNLERSLTLRDYIDGHLVAGHVDTTAEVRVIKDLGTTWEMGFVVPKSLARYIAPKGSIAINGISLTVVAIEQNTVTVALIPYTLTHTNLEELKVGDSVNVEVDMMARYVERMLGERKG